MSASLWSHRECDLDLVIQALNAGEDPNVQLREPDVHINLFAKGQRVLGSLGAEPHFLRWAPVWANFNTTLHLSLSCGHYDAAAMLLDNGADINILNACGGTVLHEAVSAQDKATVDFLIHRGADLDARSKPAEVTAGGKHFESYEGDVIPLQLDIQQGSCELVRTLLHGGASPHAVLPGCWTLLDFALVERNCNIMQILLSHGAQLSNESSPLDGHISIDDTMITHQDAARILRQNAEPVLPRQGRGVYEFTIKHLNLADVLSEGGGDDRSRCEQAIKSFSKFLAQSACRLDPEFSPHERYCEYCAEYQRSATPMGVTSFSHRPNKTSLLTSAQDGCALCVLLLDALESSSRDSPFCYGHRFPHEHSDIHQVVLVTRFDQHYIKVGIFCDAESAQLDIRFLSGMDSLPHCFVEITTYCTSTHPSSR